MQKDSPLFDDMARMFSGATNMAFDAKREMEAAIARQVEHLLNKTSLVSREEFEVVKEMATNARAEVDALKAEIESLKAKSGSTTSKATPKKTTRSTASKSKSNDTDQDKK